MGCVNRRSSPVVLLALVLSVLPGAPAVSRSPARVQVRAISYVPAQVSLPAPGARVRWTNVTDPDRRHDVIGSLPDSFASDLLGSGESFTVRFDRAGTFGYICSIHDTMLGRVEVAPVVVLERDAAGWRLVVTLGAGPLASDAPHRSSVFVQGPGDAAPRWVRTTRAASVRLRPDRPGDWTVLVRLRHRASGAVSGDSPRVTVSVPG